MAACKKAVHEPNGSIIHLHRPLWSLLSLVIVMGDWQAVEEATIGNVRMVGMHDFLGWS